MMSSLPVGQRADGARRAPRRRLAYLSATTTLVIGIGLLYQEGYFHQMIDAEGRQFEAVSYTHLTLPTILRV